KAVCRLGRAQDAQQPGCARTQSTKGKAMVLKSRAAIVFAVAILSIGLFAVSASSQTIAPRLPLKGTTLDALTYASMTRHKNSNDVMNVVVSLRFRHEQELEALIEAQRDPTSAEFHNFIDPGEFLRGFGPLQSDIDTVTRYLTAQGLAV